MAKIRVKFQIPYKVKHGADVFNEFGHSIGFVVEISTESKEDIAGNKRWEITADVDEEAKNGKLQCLEPTLPV